MEFKSPLSQRILISFVLLTTVVSGLFSFGIMGAINLVEEDLITAEFNRQFPDILGDYARGQTPKLDLGTQFYSGTEGLPYYLQDLEPGFNEVENEQSSFHVMMRKEQERPFYLVREQTTLEQHENILQGTVVAGFFLCVIASLVLGIMMIRRIIAPVKRLTDQVHNREKLLLDAPPLSSGYTDDEVGRLAQAFDRTIGMLQESLLRESLFTSDVSHELRTPLMVIKSSCELLIEKDQLDDYTRQRIDTINKATREIQELVDAFLTLARGHDTEQESASLDNVIQKSLHQWRQRAEEKGLTFTLKEYCRENESPQGLYPAPLLRTVLNNLIFNAIHHTKQGVITLAVQPTGFSVSDTGAGISEAEKQAVFKPFYRGESHNRKGLGLGLSIVQRICQREDWDITITDNQPTGCCFTVSLKK